MQKEKTEFVPLCVFAGTERKILESKGSLTLFQRTTSGLGLIAVGQKVQTEGWRKMKNICVHKFYRRTMCPRSKKKLCSLKCCFHTKTSFKYGVKEKRKYWVHPILAKWCEDGEFHQLAAHVDRIWMFLFVFPVILSYLLLGVTWECGDNSGNKKKCICLVEKQCLNLKLATLRKCTWF